MMAPSQALLHIPWALDQFQWDSAALTATQAAAPPSAALAAQGAAAWAQAQPFSQFDGAAAAASDASGSSSLLPGWPDAAAPAPDAAAMAFGGSRGGAACQVCHADVSALKEYYQVGWS